MTFSAKEGGSPDVTLFYRPCVTSDGNIAQKGQAQFLTTRFDFVEDVFDDDGFDVGEAARFDRLRNRRRTGATNLLPRGKAFF